MKYLGNKKRLLPFIDQVISKTSGKRGVFCDLFTGTTNVAQYYKKSGCTVVSNDSMTYAYVLQMAYIHNNHVPSFKKVLDHLGNPKISTNSGMLFSNKYERLSIVIHHLNSLPGVEGFIYTNYTNSGTKDSQHKRQYFTEYNAKKIDAVRQTLEHWKKLKLLTDNEYYILLASLIDEADYLANISGTYGAYLKIWRSVATNKFNMKVPELIESTAKHNVYQSDANSLIEKIETDILYLDPPYNARQYAPNFHIPETIARYDNPAIYGKTGLRPYKDKISRYCVKSAASDALNDLVKKARAKYIYISYNNEGIIKAEDIRKILAAKGHYSIFEKQYRRFRTERDSEKRHYKKCDDKTTEYIHFCEVTA